MLGAQRGKRVSLRATFKPLRSLMPVLSCRADGIMAFGRGPRMCLGYILALTEIKILLAVLARTSAFRVLNPDEPYIPFPLPVPRDGLPMDFEALPRSA